MEISVIVIMLTKFDAYVCNTANGSWSIYKQHFVFL